MIKTRKYILCLIYFCNIAAAKNQQQFDLDIKSSPKTSTTTSPDVKKRKRNRTYIDFEYDELVHAKDVQREKGNVPVTIKYLEQLLKICSDITLLSEHLLELGDVLYENGQHNKASIVYTQYCSLYPGSTKQEYALYRSIISSFACILSIDRDQTKTEETLGLTEIFLKQDHFTQYRDEVAHIQTKCYEHLAASECNICTYYITRSKFPAAEKRIAKIRSYWLPKLPTLEPTIISMEAQLIEQKEKIVVAPTMKLAHNKKHMANRF